MRGLAVMGLALLAGCGEAKQPAPVHNGPPAESPAATSASAAAAAANGAPAARLAPQDITMADIEKYDLSGMGCVFVPQGRKEAVALLEDGESQLKLNGALVRLPAGKDSRELDYGTRSYYSDGKLTLEIVPDPGKAISTGPEAQEQPATVTIRDGAGVEVYRATGIYECAA